MRILFIIALSLCAFFLDLCIYRLISLKTKRHRRRQWIRIFYLGYAITVDLFIFAFILLVFRWPFYGVHSISPLPLWLAWFFFLNTIPKFAYFLLYPISRIVGKSAGKWVRAIGIFLALYTTFVLVKGALYNTRHFEVKHIFIESEKVPPAFDGYQIALFSDVHLGNLSGQQRFLQRLVKQINQLHPDVILHAGDLVNMYAFEITPKVQSILSLLHAPHGVYSVLGNHDMGVYFRNRSEKIGLTPAENTRLVMEKQAQMGWRVLQNESVQLYQGGDSIALCGVPYPPLPPLFSHSLTTFNLKATTHALDSSQYNILLCHTPKVWEMMRDSLVLTHIDLTLSGHTHAMQLKTTTRLRQWSPAQWMYRYWSGLYEYNGRYLYVNDGLGYVLYPMRIGCYPEITLITLKRKL